MKKKLSLAITLAVLAIVPLYAFAAEKAHQEVKGIVESMPANKIGIWKINGTQVKVTPKTRIDEKECVLKKGGLAEAEGKFEGKLLIATELDCETADEKDEDDEKSEDND